MLNVASFFDVGGFLHKEVFDEIEYVWQALAKLKGYMDKRVSGRLEHSCITNGMPLEIPLVLHHGKIFCARECEISYGETTKGKLEVVRNGRLLIGASLIMAGSVFMGRKIDIGQGVLVESGALIKEPAIIGDCSEIRQGAYLRGYCLIGERCIVGHTTEVKHSIFLNDAKAGHFAYIGDSILGSDVNLGAGTKFANLRFLAGNVRIKTADGYLDSGLRKLGAILGDRVQTGCNSVTNPGTLLGPETILMPNTTSPSGFHPGKSVIR